MSDVTQLLQDLSDGNREALDKFLPLVYHELRWHNRKFKFFA